MALRFSQNDLNAIKAAQAIRDYNDAAINFNNRAIANQAAQAKQSQGGLGGVLAGIGESIGNVGKGLAGIFGGGIANIGDIATSIATGKATTKNQDDFSKWLAGSDNLKDARLKNAGTALDAAATVSDLIPGLGTGARVALNIGQGAASGIGQELADNGANASVENALRRGVTGAAAAGAGQFVGNKLAKGVAGNGRIAKALNSNVGKGALTGAAAGAVGGGLGTALYGGDLGQTLAGALQGAGGGALGGGAMAGTMGLLGTGLDKIGRKINPDAANVVNQLPDSAITKKATVQPEAPARRGIAVTDYDAGEQRVNVRRPNAQTNEYNLGKNVGSTIDGVLGPDNPLKLPNAKRPTDTSLFKKMTGGDFDNAADMLAKNPGDLELLKNTNRDLYNRILEGARDYSDLNALQFDGTGAGNKSSLPELNRQQYYEDTIGKLHATDAFGGQTSTSAADVPDYMRSHLVNDTTGELNGRTLKNDDILREFFRGREGDTVDSMDLNELYGKYEALAQAANQNEIYTPENIANGMRMNGLNDEATRAYLERFGARQNIDVDQYPSLRKPVEVGIETPDNAETVYAKRTLPARNEQDLPAVRGQVAPAAQEEVPLIQKGTPEYEAIQRQEMLDNKSRELRDIVTDGIRSQYGTIRLGDRVDGVDDAIMELAGYGLTKRSQIDGFAKRITGSNGEMSKAIRKAMVESGKTDGRLDIDMPEVYKQAGASGNKAAMDQISSRFNSMGKKYTVDENGYMNRSDMYDFGRELEREGYRMIEYAKRSKDSGGVDRAYGNAMKILGENYIAKATDGVPMGDYINKNKLKNVLPGNEAWAKHVDDVVPTIKTVSQARSFMAAPTKLSLLADAAEFNKGTYGANVGNLALGGKQAVRAITSGSPARAAVQYGAAKAVDSNVVKDRVIKNALKKYNNIKAGGTGGLGAGAGKIAEGIGNKISGVTKALNNNTLNNASYAGVLPTFGDVATRQIARQAGLAAYDDAALANEQNNAQSAFNAAQADYQNALGNYQNVMAQAQAQEQANSAGARQLETLSGAMDRALAAGDVKAYGQLADLYKQAYSIYSATAKAEEPKALSATQSKALAASQQLDQLEAMKPGASTALANSPLGFLVNLGGGDQYANQSKALATTLGYLLSGANIRETEAERIGQAYVPSAFDSEPVRQQKLARARQLIQSYMGSTDDLTQA